MQLPTSTHPALAEYIEDYLAEDELTAATRERGIELGVAGVSPATGNALRFLAAALRARAVVEVGTGVGVSGLYLLSGMAADGILTSIDVEPEHQAVARTVFRGAVVGSGRTRLIMGKALDVLPRLTDAGYDLVFVDAARSEYPHYHEQAIRLLRPGGVLAFANVLAGGRVAEPARRDAEVVALRGLATAVREDERLAPALLPLGDGLLLAAKR
ncbi:MAG: O-methyltransferase [Sciscionella sp.]